MNQMSHCRLTNGIAQTTQGPLSMKAAMQPPSLQCVYRRFEAE